MATQGTTHFGLWPLRAAGVVDAITEAVGEIDEASGLIAATTGELAPPPGLTFLLTLSN